MNVHQRMQFVNITGQVEKAVTESGITAGLCLVNSMHTLYKVKLTEIK